MSTYQASVRVDVEQHPVTADQVGRPSPFANRSASFDVSVVAKTGGLEESAHAIVAALEEAATQARRAIQGAGSKISDGSRSGAGLQ
jgi:ribosomal protein S9